MTIECTRENLNTGLGVVGRIIPNKPSLPILSNVLLCTDGGRLKLTGTDLEIGAMVDIGAKVGEEGTVAAPARLLFDYVANNQDPIISLKKDGTVLLAESNHFKASIATQDAAEYPQITPIENAVALRVPKVEFLEAAKDVAIACSVDESRPVLSGVYLYITKDELKMVGTDSYRLAEYKIALKKEKELKPVIVPRRIMQELVRCATGAAVENIDIMIGDKEIRFKFGSIELFSRLIDGNFPDYEKILPKNFTTTALLGRGEFLNVIKASSAFGRNLSSSVKITVIPEGKIKVRSSSSEYGQLESSVETTVTGEEVEASFNLRFLLDILGALTTPEIQFMLNDKNSPAVIKPKDSQNYIYLMMPLRIE